MVASSVRSHFFDFHKSAEKLCASWVLPLIECVAVWTLKLPVPHTDALKTHSSQRFLRNYWNPRELTANIYCKSTIIPLCLLWICSSNMKSFSDNSFSGICGKELHFLLDLTLSNEKLRYTCNSFCQILRKALLLEEIARIFLRNMQRFFTFKPIYVALRPRNALVLQDLLSACLRYAS